MALAATAPFTAQRHRFAARRLQEPGLEIGSMFRRIAADVNMQTNGRQRPETYVSLIGEYFLNQKDMTLAWAAWFQEGRRRSGGGVSGNFIARFPSSPRVSDAQYRLEMLERLARERPVQPPQIDAEAAARAKAAATELEQRVQREAALLRHAEEQRLKVAAIEREQQERKLQQPTANPVVEPQKQAALTVGVPPPPQIATLQSHSVSQDQACKRDEERLTRLRVSQERDEVLRFERELGCTRLRSQVMRLKESVLGVAVTAEREVPKNSRPAPPRPNAAAAPAVQPAQQDEACKRDEQRLARLRISQSRDEILRFEGELTCARLRSQVVRLRESVGAQ